MINDGDWFAALSSHLVVLMDDLEHMENLLGLFVAIILSLWLSALCVVTPKPEHCLAAG